MLTLYDEFAGVGGSSLGASRVPGVEVIFAANHWDKAIETHQANFPTAEHVCCDVQQLNLDKVPRVDIFWASPACPPWTDARGKKRDFDRQTVYQGVLWGEGEPDPGTKRARALMEEVVRYLRAKNRQGKPVLVGAVENVVQCRLWADWDRWVKEIESEGYSTRVIAFNSMHANAPRSMRAPQSRDRLYVAYWHHSLGRTPDWDKWLRPKAWCPTCDRRVNAMQVFKRPGMDMGRYRLQYVYRCPSRTCRHQVVEPDVVPASAVLDLSIPGTRIKDRPEGDRLAPATVERIKAGMRRHWLPLLTRPARRRDHEVPTLLVPAGAQPVRDASPTLPGLPPLVMRNFTARGDQGQMSTPISEPLRTLTASGKQALLSLLVSYYGSTKSATPSSSPIGTLTTRERYGLARLDAADLVEVDEADADALVDELFGEVRFRMLTPREIGDAMAIDSSYRVLATSKADITRLYGNAVTPPVAELIVSALVECVTGEALEVAA
jgi:Site-specific DNA methylase